MALSRAGAWSRAHSLVPARLGAGGLRLRAAVAELLGIARLTAIGTSRLRHAALGGRKATCVDSYDGSILL